MPKRIGFLYEKMCDKDFIRTAILVGSRKKRDRWDVKMVLDDFEYYVDLMYEIVTTYSYIPTQPKMKKIYDPSSRKTREIGVQPFFPDGIMQQMIVAAMRPVIMRGMSHWCCACIPGRGCSWVLRYAKRIVQRKRRKSKYAAELDVKRFYPSIPQKGVIKKLERKIKDKKFILLIAITFFCYPQGQAYAMRNNLTAYDIVGEKVGMFIGFYINQWLANFYLEELDTLIIKADGVSFEYRYMDNINAFSPNKRKLHRAVNDISAYLSTIGLTLKDNWQIYRLDNRALSTVGYRIFRNKTILRKRNFLRFCRQSRKIYKKIKYHRKIPVKMAAGFLSRIGQLKHSDSKFIRSKYVDPIRVKRLKTVIKSNQVKEDHNYDRSNNS